MNAPLPGVQQTREFTRALAARAMLRLGEGKTEAAWQDLVACHRLGRLLGRGPTLTERLVGIAAEAVATHAELAFIEATSPDASQAAQYLHELSMLPPIPDIAESVTLCERFFFLDAMLLIARTGGKSVAPVTGNGLRLPSLSPDSVDWDVAVSIGNQWYGRFEEAFEQREHHERRKMLADIEHDLKELSRSAGSLSGLAGLASGAENPREGAGRIFGNLMVLMLLPAGSAAGNAHARAHQHEGNVRIAFALAAYRSDHARYPENLAELAPKYLQEVPGDLFNGEPLLYRVTQDGYLLYSVGMNGQDDGGRTKDDEPGEDGLRGDDVRVRMSAGK
ncbi:MAG: hypothetical protein HYS13_02345 [Planctomycetia bacterium]|nr:hypothetical protein [Planctomycetia bacterium]